MQEFKKSIYFKAHGEAIQCQNISDKDSSLLKKFVESFVGSHDTNNIFISARQKLNNYKTFSGLESAAEIAAALKEIGLLNEDFVIVIWKYPNDIDKFKSEYLIQNWEDIWYGTSDEAVLLFFPEQGKIILVTHYNCIYYA